MKHSNSPIEALPASITKLSHDGRGIAHVNGKTTFVFGALPGEEVLLSYHKRRAKFDEASMQRVLTPSPTRVAPKCDFFGLCGKKKTWISAAINKKSK